MVGTDCTFLPYLLGHPSTQPIDPTNNQPVDLLQERINLLLTTLDFENETILIPMPAFSEFLVLADKDGQKYINKIDRSPLYQWGHFDLKAAVELAAIRRGLLNEMSNRAVKRQTPADTKAKVSFDRQIVAIARANGAHTIYSDDAGVRRFAEKHGVHVIGTWQLPRPPLEQQHSLFRTLEAQAESESVNDEAQE